MKRKLFWLLVLVFDLISILVIHGYTHAQVSPDKFRAECPIGYYEIDANTCKREPTGCPYGDSIPLDSPKCAPQVDSQNDNVLYNAYEPTSEPDATVGK